MGSSR